jgi:hypothetical protein
LPLHDLAVAIDKELCEVPFDVLGQDAALLALQEAEQRVLCVRSTIAQSFGWIISYDIMTPVVATKRRAHISSRQG